MFPGITARSMARVRAASTSIFTGNAIELQEEVQDNNKQ